MLYLVLTRPSESWLRAVESENPGGGLFLVDGEHYRAALALRRGIGHGTQVEILVHTISFQGGFLDSTIEGFHELFSLGQAGRLGANQDGFVVFVQSGEQELFVGDDPALSLGDIILGVKTDLFPRRRSKSLELAIGGKIKLPTGESSAFTSSGSLDFGVEFLATQYFRKSCLHLSIGALMLGEMEQLGLNDQVRTSGMIGFERVVGDKSTVLIQATLLQSPFADLKLEELAAISTQVTLGFKHVLGSQVLFIGVTENVANFDNSPDIGIHLGVTRTLGRR